MSNTAPAILQAWIYGQVFTADELAQAGEVSDSMFAKYRTGERQMPFDVAARISRYAQKRRGRTELAGCLCTAEYAVARVATATTDGRIQDEVVGAVVALGEVSAKFDADDLDGAERAVDELIRQAHAADAEIKQRRAQIAPRPGPPRP